MTVVNVDFVSAKALRVITPGAMSGSVVEFRYAHALHDAQVKKAIPAAPHLGGGG